MYPSSVAILCCATDNCVLSAPSPKLRVLLPNIIEEEEYAAAGAGLAGVL